MMMCCYVSAGCGLNYTVYLPKVKDCLSKALTFISILVALRSAQYCRKWLSIVFLISLNLSLQLMLMIISLD
jgi:hypothetical protein